MSDQSSTFDITNPATTIAGELVGEGKKFKTVDDLARGKLEADTFIDKLKTENAALREALDSDGSPDEVLKRINDLLQSKGSENATATKSNQSPSESLTEEKVLELLSKREREEKVKSNINLFNANVNKAFGDKTGEVVATRLGALGMEREVFNDLAARNPNAALRILGIKEDGLASGSVGSSVNTEAYFGDAGKGNDGTQNFAYFQKMRREMGSAYYEPEIQKKVFEARKRLGDAFWKQ